MRTLREKVWFSLRWILPDWLMRLYERRKWQREVSAIPLPDMSSPYRVLVTPARHAGQGKLWSDALNTRQGVSAWSVTVQNQGFGHDTDYAVSWVYATLSRRWQKEMRQTLSAYYTHILIEASLPPLGGSFGGNLRRQVTWLRQRGVKVGFIAHGSEVRLPSRHVESEEWSPFADPRSSELTATLETIAVKNAHLYRDFNVPSFVSTAGLKLDLPEAVFLGVVVDSRRYATHTPLLQREKLIVSHISSHSVLKATEKLGPLLERLEAEGIIEFREYSGIAQEQVPEILAESDVVLDQFALGDYGVFACEALASGRVVLSHVSEQVRSEILRSSGCDLPIPETTLDNIEWRLRDIAARREHYREVAAQGPAFVQRVHSGAFSAEVLYRHFLKVG